MKELSIEEKAKAYDGLIERLKDLKFSCRFSPLSDTIEEMFPELKESEDERIRKAIITCFQRFPYERIDDAGTNVKEVIAWLEKQGYEPNWCHHNVDLSNCSEEYRKAYYDGWNNCNMQHSQCESEKSYILKCLINGMKFYYEDNKEATWGTEKFSMKVKDILSWLEKQGNKDMGISNTTKQKLKDNLDNALEKETPESWNEFLEKQGDDKVEPKFKVGDWVISPNGVYWHIDAINNNRYEVSSTDGACADWPLDTDLYHLWTIQDAKDGDVLCCESGWTCIFKTLVNDETFSSYCFMDNTKWFCETGCECHTLNKEFMKAYNGEIKPATKEQRDILFSKMKEAGYEWDAEKKELREIEQKPAEDSAKVSESSTEEKDMSEYKKGFECGKQRVLKYPEDFGLCKKTLTAWSEEDEDNLNSAIYYIRREPYCECDVEPIVDWLRNKLKYLRPQNRWKPSDEQMNTLEQWLKDNQYKGDARYCYPIFESLYQDLKKLKE